MRFLSHILALVLALVAFTPAPATTTSSALIAHANTASHTASHTPDTQPRAITENDPGWVCWTMGNARCSSVPLQGPGDASPQVTDVRPLCVTDEQCDELGLASDVMWT